MMKIDVVFNIVCCQGHEFIEIMETTKGISFSFFNLYMSKIWQPSDYIVHHLVLDPTR